MCCSPISYCTGTVQSSLFWHNTQEGSKTRILSRRQPIRCVSSYRTATSRRPVCALFTVHHRSSSSVTGDNLCICSISPHTCHCPTDIWYLPPLVCLVFLALIPLWAVVARQNPQTREVLRSGWQPVIVAMSISRYVLWEANWEAPFAPRWASLVRIHVSLIASLCDFQCWRPHSGQDGERSQLQGHGCVHARHQR